MTKPAGQNKAQRKEDNYTHTLSSQERRRNQASYSHPPPRGECRGWRGIRLVTAPLFSGAGERGEGGLGQLHPAFFSGAEE